MATGQIPLSQLKAFMQRLKEPMGFGEAYVASQEELEDAILGLGMSIRKGRWSRGSFRRLRRPAVEFLTSLSLWRSAWGRTWGSSQIVEGGCWNPNRRELEESRDDYRF